MCTNEVGMSLEVVHTILSSQHRVVHANQVNMSLNTTPGADLDILFRGVDLLTDIVITYTHNYSINNIVSRSYYTPGP